jgi:predicted HicB family RNase H-like nuclease
MSIPRKPQINEDEFIKSSKANNVNLQDNSNTNQKEKTFLLRLNYDLWKKLKEKSLAEDKTLHQYIIDSLKSRL